MCRAKNLNLFKDFGIKLHYSATQSLIEVIYGYRGSYFLGFLHATTLQRHGIIDSVINYKRMR